MPLRSHFCSHPFLLHMAGVAAVQPLPLLSAICRSSPPEAGGGTNERKRMAGYSPAASPIKSKGDLSHERNEAL